MSELIPMAVFDEQVPTDAIRQTCAMLEAIMPGQRAARGKLGACEEITDLFKRSTVLQGETQQTGHHVVETDQFLGAVGSFQSQKDFGGVFVVMHADIQSPLPSNSNLLCDVIPASGEGEAGAHAATTSRSILKLNGRSVVCRVPLGTPAF